MGRHAPDLSWQHPLQEPSGGGSAEGSVQCAAGIRTPQPGRGLLSGGQNAPLPSHIRSAGWTVDFNRTWRSYLKCILSTMPSYCLQRSSLFEKYCFITPWRSSFANTSCSWLLPVVCILRHTLSIYIHAGVSSFWQWSLSAFESQRVFFMTWYFLAEYLSL